MALLPLASQRPRALLTPRLALQYCNFWPRHLKHRRLCHRHFCHGHRHLWASPPLSIAAFTAFEHRRPPFSSDRASPSPRSHLRLLRIAAASSPAQLLQASSPTHATFGIRASPLWASPPPGIAAFRHTATLGIAAFGTPLLEFGHRRLWASSPLGTRHRRLGFGPPHRRLCHRHFWHWGIAAATASHPRAARPPSACCFQLPPLPSSLSLPRRPVYRLLLLVSPWPRMPTPSLLPRCLLSLSLSAPVGRRPTTSAPGPSVHACLRAPSPLGNAALGHRHIWAPPPPGTAAPGIAASGRCRPAFSASVRVLRRALLAAIFAPRHFLSALAASLKFIHKNAQSLVLVHTQLKVHVHMYTLVYAHTHIYTYARSWSCAHAHACTHICT